MSAKKLTRRERYAIKNYLESQKQISENMHRRRYEPERPLGICSNIKPPKDLPACTTGYTNPVKRIELHRDGRGGIEARFIYKEV